MKIEILPNEYWWGCVADFGKEMPWNEKSNCVIDPTTMGKDQRSPLAMSSLGRCIWNEKPFVLTFQNGIIETDTDVHLETTSGGLKGAHKLAGQRLFLNKKQPNRCFFEKPQYNTWIEMMYRQNQEGILDYAHAIVDHGMEPGVFMIDEGWSEDYGVFDFYPGRFRDPKKMIAELHELGFTVMLWVTPHISPDGNCFRSLRNTDILLHDASGEIAVRKWWNGYSCVLDLSNPVAVKWFHEKLKSLQDAYHIDGFKFDAGSPNMYLKTDRRTNVRVPLECTNDYATVAMQYPFNELRECWNMGGSPLVCRLMDKTHTWDDTSGIGALIPNMLAQGLLGYYYGCPDMIGGGDYSNFLGNGQFDEELYIRWLEASLLCPMLQFSVAPWRVLSKENYQIVKKLLALRERYVPYILELAEHAAKHHEPIIRPLAYEFPHQEYETENSMYMLGSRYLVVPMLEKNTVAKTIRLPSGIWRESDGTKYIGGKAVTLEFPLNKVYVFEKID